MAPSLPIFNHVFQVKAFANASIATSIRGAYTDDDEGEAGFLQNLHAVQAPTCDEG